MTSGFFPYWVCALLALIGLHGMLFRPNLMRKLMGLNILQVSVILFYLLLAFKSGAGAPILSGLDSIEVGRYANPLPHALMLTAIVVGVSTTGVGLAMLVKIHRIYGTLKEPDVLKKLK